MRIEGDRDNFTSMAAESRHFLSSDGAPDFSGVIERASTNFITKWDIECHAVDGVFMSFQGMDEVSSGGVPEFAGTIVAAGEELVAVFVEAAVGEGEDMAFEFFDKSEFLLFFVLDLFDQFLVKG